MKIIVPMLKTDRHTIVVGGGNTKVGDFRIAATQQNVYISDNKAERNYVISLEDILIALVQALTVKHFEKPLCAEQLIEDWRDTVICTGLDSTEEVEQKIIARIKAGDAAQALNVKLVDKLAKATDMLEHIHGLGMADFESYDPNPNRALIAKVKETSQ